MYSSLIDKTAYKKPKPLPNAMSDLVEWRPFSQIKLIIFDLDGTLIPHADTPLQPTLLDRVSYAIKYSRIPVTLATGRAFSGVENVLEQFRKYERNPIPLILYNGSVVMQPQQLESGDIILQPQLGERDVIDFKSVINYRMITSASAKEVLRLVSACVGVSAFFYCIDPEARSIGKATVSEKVYFFSNSTNIIPNTDFNGIVVAPILTMDFESGTVVAILLEVVTPEARAFLYQKLQKITGISVTSSGSKYIELRPAGSSKAIGASVVVDKLGISAEHVLAVGDNDNDVELLEWAGISVCVQNASPAAQQASNFYSHKGAGEAAIEVLQLMRLSQRLFKGENKHGKKYYK